jgi:hypothetical protein
MMARARQVSAAATFSLIVCLSISIFLLQRVDEARPQATLEEVLYLPSPQIVKRLSLGYEGLLADVYWTRAVQYFGNHHAAGAEHYDLLAPLLDIATKLDPHLVVAYDFGANFLAPDPPNGAGDPRAAIKLTEYGIQNNPNEWHLYYNLGFIYYLDLKDYGPAADAFAKGALIAGAHPFLRVLAAQMAEHAGETQTARTLWATAYETSRDKDIRANAAAHLRALQIDDDVTKIEAMADEYYKVNKHYPASFADLRIETPLDPLGEPYRLTADGLVVVRHPDNFPFLTKGAPAGYVPPRAPKFLPAD